jgi:hypothetical protein
MTRSNHDVRYPPKSGQRPKHALVMQRVATPLFVAAYNFGMLLRAKKLVLTKRQKAIVDHLGRWMTDAERARYMSLVENTLRETPGCSDMKVSRAAIQAATACRR